MSYEAGREGQDAIQAVTAASSEADLLISRADVDAYIQQSSTLEYSSDALVVGSRHLKDVLGSPKKPVAARISVMDMTTTQYIATSTSFLLMSVQRTRKEKVQFTYGFDEQWLLTTFGKDISIYVLSGILVNMTGKQDWVSKMNDYYERYLRASRLSARGHQAVCHYADRWMRGYFLGFDEVVSSRNNHHSSFTMPFVIRRDRTVGAREGQI